MTTIVPVSFSPLQAPSFTITLDGTEYTVTLTWNLYGQRYYINVSDLSNNLILSLPLIGSPDGIVIESLTWASGLVTVTTSLPHGYRPGTTVRLTLGNVTPDAYNGVFDMLVTGASTLTFPLMSNPGVATAPGILFTNIDLAAGYFETSTLVWRPSSSQLEVNP
jgi:hypothetical protein